MNLSNLSSALAGLAQVIVPAAVTYAATKGWLGNGDAASISAAIITLLSAGWSGLTTKLSKGN